jgi:hypothetical protein
MPAKQLSLRMPNKQVMLLPDNKHNRLQKAVIDHFLPRFVRGASLVCLKHSSKSKSFYDIELFSDLGIQIDHRDCLPDIVLLNKRKKWLYLIQTITSHKPSVQQRLIESKKMFSGCSFGLIFINAFSSFADLNKYTTEIVWETEIWIAEVPDHLIHCNGDRFLGPHYIDALKVKPVVEDRLIFLTA